MDGQKDIQRTNDQLTAAFDSYVPQVHPFGENRSAERAYQRGERISAAVHLLTNHVPLNEPLRASVRTQAIALLQNLMSLRDQMRVSHSSGLVHVLGNLRQLSSMIRLLSLSGFVSLQNAQLVMEAIDELGTFLESSQKSSMSESVSLSRGGFIDSGEPTPRNKASNKHRSVIQKDSSAIKDISAVSDNSAVAEVTVRQRHVMSILQTGALLSIRDIVAHLPEYSEKTIQRELAELTLAGKVRKIGSKRWSRYALSTA